jgi:hypothetical protein
MEYKIGGEFEIPYDLLLRPKVGDNSIAKKRYSIRLDVARSAIFVALKEIVKRGGKPEAWLPRYCCESMLIPFDQMGFKINFYSMGDCLNRPYGLPERIDNSTFLFIHYFGKKNLPIIDWLIGQGKRFFVIEDCVQACLNEGVGHYGDFAVYSFRKFFPQPDGALLASDNPIDYKLAPPREEFISKKFLGKVIRQYGGESEVFLELFNTAEKLIDKKICPRNMSWLSSYIFERTDLVAAKNKRRANFSYMTGLLKSTRLSGGQIELLFDNIEKEEVPLGLPVKIKAGRRDELRRFLMSQNIFCAAHWPLKENGDHLVWKTEFELSKSILTLPIDQRLNKDSLEYMVDRLDLFFKRKS